MSDNFQQTVDLREQMEKRKKAAAAPRSAGAPLEKIYLEDEKKDLGKISRPKVKEAPAGLIKVVIFILAALVIGATVYFLFFRSKGEAGPPRAADWYAVKLTDGEIFYGQIADVKADPVVMNNVYYNYDQTKQTGAGKDLSRTAEETGNIRLVKRGKETHGPDGSMDIVRAQVLFMEPLKADSKVLQAILEYEK